MDTPGKWNLNCQKLNHWFRRIMNYHYYFKIIHYCYILFNKEHLLLQNTFSEQELVTGYEQFPC